jgi:hypothetical protein
MVRYGYDVYRGVSMLLGWQEFQYLQIIGFALLLVGAYHHIIVMHQYFAI